MKPKLPSRDKNRDLFREELIDILDMSHNLCVTADLLDWSLFREAFDKEFPSKTGRSSHAITIDCRTTVFESTVQPTR